VDFWHDQNVGDKLGGQDGLGTTHYLPQGKKLI